MFETARRRVPASRHRSIARDNVLGTSRAADRAPGTSTRGRRPSRRHRDADVRISFAARLHVARLRSWAVYRSDILPQRRPRDSQLRQAFAGIKLNQTLAERIKLVDGQGDNVVRHLHSKYSSTALVWESRSFGARVLLGSSEIER